MKCNVTHYVHKPYQTTTVSQNQPHGYYCQHDSKGQLTMDLLSTDFQWEGLAYHLCTV